MGLEAGDGRLVGLVDTNPLNSDERSKGASHLRLIKTAVKSLINAVPGASGPVDYVIASGSFTPTTGGTCYLYPETAGPDTLDHINHTNCPEGSVVILRCGNPSYPISVVDSTTGEGRIRPRGGYTMILQQFDAYIMFQRLGGIWRELSRGGDYQKAVDRVQSLDFTPSLSAYAFQLPGGDYLHFELELRALKVIALAELRIDFSQNGGSSYLSGSDDYLSQLLRVGGPSNNITANSLTSSAGLGTTFDAWSAGVQLDGTIKVYHAGPAFAMIDCVLSSTGIINNWRSRVSLVANDNGINAVRVQAGGDFFTNGAVTLYGWL